MTRGLPWTVEEEIQLKAFMNAKTPMDIVAAKLGRQPSAILMKCQRLGITTHGQVTNAAIPLPPDLPSVEETLKKLAGAMEAASAPGLNRVEVQRLQALATLAKTYKEILADYLDYRRVEAKLNDMEVKYATLQQSKRKRMHHELFRSRWQQLQQTDDLIEEATLEDSQRINQDPIAFCKDDLGFVPFSYQEKFVRLFVDNQFTAARWGRQSGKTFIASALLLWYAVRYPDSAIGIVGPSWRQTKRVLSRIGSLGYKLPPGLMFKPQRTQIHLSNGSTIEAFPNNPETIRGPTLHVVYADEFNFIANDQELYDAILYTLGTTDGKFVCTSTPWHTDSVFYRIFNHKDYADFKTLHVSVEQAMEPNGPLKPGIIQKIRTQMGDDPTRWRREMEAEWAEDQDVWLTQSLIASCIGTTQNCGEDLKEMNVESEHHGEFFAGLDLAQTRDYCVLAVVESLDDRLFLRHLKIFKQPTIYATVLGYIKVLQDRLDKFRKILVDNTREGPSFIAEMKDADIQNAEGVTFSVPRKSEMASVLSQRMKNHQFYYPLLHWERPYRGDICNELNVERYSLNRDGAIGYHHPQGTHDDVFWAIALAVYAKANMKPVPAFGFVYNSQTTPNDPECNQQ